MKHETLVLNLIVGFMCFAIGVFAAGFYDLKTRTDFCDLGDKCPFKQELKLYDCGLDAKPDGPHAVGREKWSK